MFLRYHFLSCHYRFDIPFLTGYFAISLDMCRCSIAYIVSRSICIANEDVWRRWRDGIHSSSMLGSRVISSWHDANKIISAILKKVFHPHNSTFDEERIKIDGRSSAPAAGTPWWSENPPEAVKNLYHTLPFVEAQNLCVFQRIKAEMERRKKEKFSLRTENEFH